MKKLQLKNNGSALPLAIVAVAILLVLGSTLLSMGLSSRIYSLRTATDITARCAADAGLTRALYEMNQKLKVKPWDDSTLPLEKQISLTNCDANYSYIVTGNLGGGGNSTVLALPVPVQRQVAAVLLYDGPSSRATPVECPPTGNRTPGGTDPRLLRASGIRPARR